MSLRSPWPLALSLAAALAAGAAAPAVAAGAVTTSATLTAASTAASTMMSLSACEEDELPAEAEPVRLILPCSLADHAFVSPSSDPSCADATIYVVTDAGVLLCQIDVSALAWSSAPQLKKAPLATFFTSPSFSTAAATASAAVLLPPLVVIDLAAAHPQAMARARDGFARPPTVPS